MTAIDRIRQRFKTLESGMERDAVLIFSEAEDVWMSESAKALLSRKKVSREDLLERLRWQRKRMSAACCCGLGVAMMSFPGDDGFVVFLREEQSAEASKFRLTPKEREVLDLLVIGRTNKEIAERLGISPGTVNAHLDSIYRKLNVSNRLEAAFVALREGVVLPREAGPAA
ncbi:MAG: hypothetical protein Kow0025_04750 [Thermodesulfovibrionales bacterium]